MAHFAIRPRVIRATGAPVLASGAICVLTMTAAPSAGADAAAYLLNVTVRPGYNFVSSDAALTYGHHICDKVTQGRTYGQIMGDVKADFDTSDEYHASYLISQAVNELCPSVIWQLRNSAAQYRAQAR